MKYRFLHMMVCCLLLLPVVLSVSCSNDAEESEVPLSTETLIKIGLQVRNNDGENLYEFGDKNENYIDVFGGNYRVYFFDTDNKFIADFDPDELFLTEGKNYNLYNIQGRVPDELVGYRNFKMVVLANWPEYPEVNSKDSQKVLRKGVTTISDVCNADWARYDCLTDGNETNPTSVAPNVNEKRFVPFFGVHEYKNVTFKSGLKTDLSEPITLLRAMAKVEVILQTDNYFDLTFRSLKVNRYNAQGYCAPKDVFSQSQYDHNGNWNKDYARRVHLWNDKNDEIEKELSFRFVDTKAEGDKLYKTWVAYLPEYDNRKAGDAYSSIKALFDIQLEGDTPHTIYFAKYRSGKPDKDVRLDIERNNIYRFYVTCSGYNFNLKLTVSDWEGLYENNFDFGNGQIVSPVSPWEGQVSGDVDF